MILDTQGNREILIAVICEVFSVSEKQLRSRSRDRSIVAARQVFFKVAREKLGLSLLGCSKLLSYPDGGYKDHTTVMHAVRVLNDMLAVGDTFAVTTTMRVLDKLHQVADKGMRLNVTVHPEDIEWVKAWLDKNRLTYTVSDGVTLVTIETT